MSEQPAPAAYDPAKPVVVDELVQLYLARKELGIQRYSVPLQPDNGRDMARDALEEALDLSVYLMGMVLELRAKLARLGSAELLEHIEVLESKLGAIRAACNSTAWILNAKDVLAILDRDEMPLAQAARALRGE